MSLRARSRLESRLGEKKPWQKSAPSKNNVAGDSLLHGQSFFDFFEGQNIAVWSPSNAGVR